jgi:hypothetical protein
VNLINKMKMANEAETVLMEQRIRAAVANTFLAVVGNCGECYFRSNSRDSFGCASSFQLDENNRIWFGTAGQICC